MHSEEVMVSKVKVENSCLGAKKMAITSFGIAATKVRLTPMLICHIATSLLEVRYPHPASDDKITATHLSRYCAYLVAHVPELLPDDDKWCKSLYKGVKKNSLDVLVSGYDDLVTLLSGSDRHEVLGKGAALATKLAGMSDVEGSTAWVCLLCSGQR